jgi:site-specific recombinase XerD
MNTALEAGRRVVNERLPNGAAALHLAPGLAFLREDAAVFEAMLDGWRSQQLGGRNLRVESVNGVCGVVRRFRDHANEYPWAWTAALMDDWTTDLVSVRRLAPSTIRSYQNAVRQFCDFICSPHYGWVAECEERFGTHPIQICHEWNTSRHLQGYEGGPGRRPLTRTELQLLFDHADAEVPRRLESGRKGALGAYRDATLLKVTYAWGLRASEAVGLDVTDFYRNPHAPEFGDYGMLQVRNGKASRGSAPKRRSVASLRLWAVDAVQDYLDNMWPLLRNATSNAMWLSERGSRLRTRELSNRFAEYRRELGFDAVLTPHALRHSYVTHLIEDGVDPVFVQQQVGHAYQSTTAIYTAVSGDYANVMMRRAISGLVDTKKETGS